MAIALHVFRVHYDFKISHTKRSTQGITAGGIYILGGGK